MNSYRYTYWEHADPPHEERHLIPDTPKAREQALCEGATAFCTVSFSEPYEKGKPEPVRYGDLYLDFDCKDNPLQAIKDAVAFVTAMLYRFDFDPNSLHYWLSGGKGCHIAIPAALFGGEDGDPKLPLIYAAMLKEISESECNPIAATLDYAMYQMKTGRLLRIENVKRRNGRYKVPLTWDEFSCLTGNELLTLTKHPRTLPTHVLTVERCPRFEEFFQRVQMSVNDLHSNQIHAVEAMDKECTFLAHCRDDASSLSEPKWFAMLTNLAVLGHVGFELAHSYSRPYPQYKPDETNRKLAHARDGAPITCESIKKLWDCKRNCGVKCPYQLYRTDTKKSKGGHFLCDHEGLYYLTDPHDLSTKGQWISAPLEILAQSRDASNGSWGRVVSFNDVEGVTHRLIISMAEIGGNGDLVRQKLLEQGLRISPDKSAKDLLIRYLNDACPQQLARMVKRFGWHGDTYVLRDIAYGQKQGELFIPEIQGSCDTFQCAGTLEEWQEHIGRYCQGNPLLALAVSFAFTGPLLTPCQFEGGGLHFFGPSSCGKTTAMKVAGSVCGGGGKHGYIRQWRATDNALESTAAQHNDNLLCLDEIGQAVSRVVSEVAYMLANGQGKSRANKDGSAKGIQEWRISFMSTGELTLADKIAEDGRGQIRAGQAVRVLDIPADGGTGHGIFSSIPDEMDGQRLSQALSEATGHFYGTPFRAFLEHLTTDIDGHVTKVGEDVSAFVRNHCPENASPQVNRACQRFGLIAAAGALAVRFGILPWFEGMPEEAALFGFKAWIKERGGIGDMEIEYALERVKSFFQKNSDSRFQLIENNDIRGGYINNPAGFKWNQNGEWVYLVVPNVLQEELCRGVNRTTFKAALREQGWLALNQMGKPMETKRIPGKGNIRGTVFVPRVWEDAGGNDETVSLSVSQMAADDNIF